MLTNETIQKYETIYKQYGKSINDISKIDEEVKEKIGRTVFPNINRGNRKKSKENIFLDNHRKSYQESVSAFEKIKEVYASTGRRKIEGTSIPLRLEIDSFLSFVRDMHATHETWREQPVGWNESRKRLLLSHIHEWFNTDWQHYDDTIIQANYPLITKVFESNDSINKSDINELVDALVVLHSFHDRLRFYLGGLSTLRTSFMRSNNISRVKKSLSYLLFGKGDIVKRMADLIYDGAYKLNEFGQANVQELVGWINIEDLPVVNGRTTKVLRYYGFDVRQL